MPGALAPHERLLAACAIPWSDAATARAVDAALQEPIVWERVMDGAVRHGIAPLLSLHLSEDARVPAPARARIARIRAAVGRRNAVLLAELERLVAALQVARIPCLLLKGAALAREAYPDPSLRNFADMDILVPGEHLGRAGEIARSLGFLASAVPHHSLSHSRNWVRQCGEDILTETLAPDFGVPPDPARIAGHLHRVVVEIHDRLFVDASGLARRVDLTEFWRHRRQIALPGGAPAGVPSLEATLVFVCAHAASHDYARLIFFADATLWTHLHEHAIDWERVAGLARTWSVVAAVCATLDLARREFGAPVPPEALKAMRRSAGVVPPLALPDIFHRQQAAGSRATLRRWLEADSGRQRMAAALRLLLPPPDVIRAAYGVDSAFPAWPLYALRPFTLLGRLPRAARQSARRRESRAGRRERANEDLQSLRR